MPWQEILKFKPQLDAEDPRFEVVEALVKAYRLHTQAA